MKLWDLVPKLRLKINVLWGLYIGMYSPLLRDGRQWSSRRRPSSILLPPAVLSRRLRGETSAAALLLASLVCPGAAGLEARPAVPSCCQRRCLPQPQIKKRQRGRQEKWLAPSFRTYVKNVSVLQVICYSLGSFHYYFKEREREREMKGRTNSM